MPLLQHSGKLRGTRCAIAFADQEFRRSPAIIARDVLIDEIGEPVGILDDAVELRRCFPRGRTAVPRGNRVDEDEVRGIEKRILIVRDGVRRGHPLAIGSQHHALWSHAHMREKRSGPWPAVIDEAHGPLGGISDTILGVSDVKHRCLHRAVVRLDVIGRGRRRVVDHLAADTRRVMRDSRLLFWCRRVLRLLALSAFILRRRLLCWQAGTRAHLRRLLPLRDCLLLRRCRANTK